MALTEDALLTRARRSYELGRLRATIRDSWVVAPIVLAVGVLATKQREGRLPFLAATTLITGMTGAVGCALAGFLGITGMIAGGLLGLLPVYLMAQVRRA